MLLPQQDNNLCLRWLWSALLFLVASAGCAQDTDTTAVAQPYSVQAKLAHNPEYFTQGLTFDGDVLLEGTGQYGESKLIRYQTDLVTPRFVRQLPNQYFGEGISVVGDQIYQLTWKSGQALAFHKDRFSPSQGFAYTGEGWGLTTDNQGQLWRSDGSNVLTISTPDGTVLATRSVTLNGAPLDRLNELEWVHDELFANRWYDNKLYVINPDSGQVLRYLDLSQLAAPELAVSSQHVLNGIAWHRASDTLYITGKRWRSLYQLKLESP